MTFATDQFGRAITSSDNGDGTTTFSVDNGPSVTLPSTATTADVIAVFNGMSPSVASLSPEKRQKLLDFNDALEDYVTTYFDLKTQFRIKIIYDLAVAQGLTNRAAYLLPLLNWVNALMSYAATFTASVMAQSDAATVAEMQWDFGQVSVSPPSVTLIGAISILD